MPDEWVGVGENFSKRRGEKVSEAGGERCSPTWEGEVSTSLRCASVRVSEGTREARQEPGQTGAEDKTRARGQ
ncbi:hypothetical protein MHYP_G00138020 [Metynnis hypsauchen]